MDNPDAIIKGIENINRAKRNDKTSMLKEELGRLHLPEVNLYEKGGIIHS